MKKIEVGEYVRTKDGKIGIFDRYSLRKENSLYKSPFKCFIKIRNRKTPLQCCEDYIVKHSKQLIDLIEVGDILEILCNEISKETNTIRIKDIEQLKVIKEIPKFIKSVMTKEQFKNVSYEV